MFSVFRTLSLRYLQRRWFRAVLIVASIALGVATLIATRALGQTMTRAGLVSARQMAGVADFYISNGERLYVSRKLADELHDIPGVQSIHPLLFHQAFLPDLNLSVLVMGLDFMDVVKDLHDPRTKDKLVLSPDTIKNYILIDASKKIGIALFRQIPVVVGKALADEIPPGILSIKRIHVQKDPGSKPHTLMYAGSLEAHDSYASMGGFVLILELANAAEILDIDPDHVSRLDVVLQPGADRGKVRKALEQRLGGRASLRTPEEQSQALHSVMAGMQTGFSLCGVAALVVGLFLVYNALTVTVAERRHEIGILLALGATRAQILRLMAGEASILGLVGGLLGIPFGLGLAYLSLGPAQDIMHMYMIPVQVRQVYADVPLMLLAMAAGILTAVAAGLVPAWQGARENPASSVRRVEKAPSLHHLVAQICLSLTLICLGTLIILVRGSLPLRLGIYGGLMLVLVGTLVAAPFFAALAARLLQPLIRSFGSMAWRLAADNLVRSPGRTGLVIGALAAGVSLVVQTAGTIRSNRHALQEWVQDSITADLVVTSGGPVSAGQTLLMEESLGRVLRSLPMVDAVLPVRTEQLPYEDTQIYLVAVPAGEPAYLERKRLAQPEYAALLKKLGMQENGVIVSENFAALYHIRKGDVLTLPSPAGPVRLTVLGEVNDYTWNKGVLFVNLKGFRKNWKEDKVSLYEVYLKKSADPMLAKETINQRFGAQHQLVALTRAEVRTHLETMIEKLYGIAYGQQTVVMLVAALGVITALLISVLQRRREMGLLRAIGASRVQVIYSVLAEACLMGVIGTVIGLAVGIPLQWYVLRVVILEESGYLFPVHVPWGGTLIIALAAMVLATLAGLGPALHSVRMRIPEAIAWE